MAQQQSLIPNQGSTNVHPLAQPHLVREAIEPTGEGPYVDAMRDWIDNINLFPQRAPLHLVR